MKYAVVVFLTALVSVVATWFVLSVFRQADSPLSIKPFLQPTPVPTPLMVYSFANLAQYSPQPSEVTLGDDIETNNDFTGKLFFYQSEGKQISGQVNLPNDYQDKKNPVIVMMRGFVPSVSYYTGAGTRPSARIYASNGFITFAPDFLGYGQSDDPSPEAFGERLEKPMNIVDLIASIKQLEYVDPDHIFLWGHSNGGQIALSVLEITKQPYPTVLWAPVSKSFPFNILVYTDEYDDQGKALRESLAQFELVYNTDDFSLHTHWDWINAPIQIHQGGKDIEVRENWTDELVATLSAQVKENPDQYSDLDITYFKYPNADHNLRPDWDTVAQRDVEFFEKYLKE